LKLAEEIIYVRQFFIRAFAEGFLRHFVVDGIGWAS
jgi:hypothetical protein